MIVVIKNNLGELPVNRRWKTPSHQKDCIKNIIQTI